VIDGNPAALDKWVAPGNIVDADVLINLGGVFPINSVTVEGVGSPGESIGFSVFVGPAGSTESSLLASTPIGTTSETEASGGGQWSVTFNIAPTSVQYVLYEVTAACGDPGDSCSSYDNAYANDILVNAVPEPGTIGLIGAGLLALGFSLRSRKK
jgi:hypothetical protein